MAITKGHTPAFTRQKEASEKLAEQARRNDALRQQKVRENTARSARLVRENALKKQKLDRENAARRHAQNQNTNDPEKEEIKRKEKALKKRMATKDQAIAAFAKAHQTQGVMEKAEHLAGLTAEGVAGEILFDLIILSIELSINAPFWTQTLQFEEALKKELQSIEAGENERLVYLPDDNGVYPDIYPIDGSGKVDHSKPSLTPGSPEITNFAIRANGYVPIPTILEALAVIGARHTERMSGSGALSPEQKACLYNTVTVLQENQNKETNEKDTASDNAARMAAMRQEPKARLTSKP